jgi:hypothetical protein
MRLFEFDDSISLGPKLAAVTDQLKTDLEDGKLNFGMTTDQLLDYFQKYDIILDVTDLYTMYKVPPLSQVIANVNDQEITFKGRETDDIEDPDQESENEKIVGQMAKSALKK